MRWVSRRSFIKQAALAGAATLLAPPALRQLLRTGPSVALAADIPDIVAVTGHDYFQSTQTAVAALGGMPRFVRPGARVGLLVNSPFRNVGASVNPDIVLAVIDMCRRAGASGITYLKDPHRGYWDRSPRSAAMAEPLNHMAYESGDDVEVAVRGGAILESVRMNKDLADCDVFIDIAIAKHHKGVHYTGLLKNMMGLCPFTTNSFFHFGTLKLGWYGDLDHLNQCIADLNRVRSPDLCVIDGTAFITDNGPYGPGPMKTPQQVVAGVDRVAMDVYGAELLGVDPDDVLMIQKAAAHGLGNPHLQELDVRQLRL